jgi:protein-S-isoprenylcysteine O-methyltransferase Ste14
MAEILFKSAFLLSIVLQIIIRAPHNRVRQSTRIATDHVSTTEKVLIWLLFLGILPPVVYIFTDWLSFADYRVSEAMALWVGMVGLVFLGVALWLFWRAHRDLGRNWSPSLQLMDHHDLVTGGIYRAIRHPMYASQWLLALGQILVLQNWLAGPATLFVFAPLYFIRVPREESMMLEQFGAAYRAYMARTGRVFPRLGK